MPHRLKNGVRHTSKTRHPDKIQEALELLNNAARDKRHELYDLIEGQYGQLKDAFVDAAETGKKKVKKAAQKGRAAVDHAKESAHDAFASGAEKIREKASSANESVHSRPWPILAGVAVGCLIAGFILRGASAPAGESE